MAKKTISRTKIILGCVIAALVVVGLYKLPPLGFPVVKTTPLYKAMGLEREGKCDEAFAAFEEMATNGNSTGFFAIAENYRFGRCTEVNLKEAVSYYRKAAAMGGCGANFELAEMARLHADLDSITHVPPENNMLTSVLCFNDIPDSDLYSWFYTSGPNKRAVPQIFRDVLERRKKLMSGPRSEREKIGTLIELGMGYDKNSAVLRRIMR